MEKWEKSIITVKQYLKNAELHTFLLEHPKLLYLISSTEKYEKLKSEDMQLVQSSWKSFFFF